MPQGILNSSITTDRSDASMGGPAAGLKQGSNARSVSGATALDTTTSSTIAEYGSDIGSKNQNLVREQTSIDHKVFRKDRLESFLADIGSTTLPPYASVPIREDIEASRRHMRAKLADFDKAFHVPIITSRNAHNM